MKTLVILSALNMLVLVGGCGNTTEKLAGQVWGINKAYWEEMSGERRSTLEDTTMNPNPPGGFDDEGGPRPNSRIGNKGIYAIPGLEGRAVSDLLRIEYAVRRDTGSAPVYPSLGVDCNQNGQWDRGIDALLTLDPSAAATKEPTDTFSTIQFTATEAVFKATAANACNVPALYVSGSTPPVSLASLPSGVTFVGGVRDVGYPRGVALPAFTIAHGTTVSTEASQVTFREGQLVLQN